MCLSTAASGLVLLPVAREWTLSSLTGECGALRAYSRMYIIVYMIMYTTNVLMCQAVRHLWRRRKG